MHIGGRVGLREVEAFRVDIDRDDTPSAQGSCNRHTQETNRSTPENDDDLIRLALAQRPDRVNANGEGFDHRTVFKGDRVGNAMTEVRR